MRGCPGEAIDDQGRGEKDGLVYRLSVLMGIKCRHLIYASDLRLRKAIVVIENRAAL